MSFFTNVAIHSKGNNGTPPTKWGAVILLTTKMHLINTIQIKHIGKLFNNTIRYTVCHF